MLTIRNTTDVKRYLLIDYLLAVALIVVLFYVGSEDLIGWAIGAGVILGATLGDIAAGHGALKILKGK